MAEEKTLSEKLASQDEMMKKIADKLGIKEDNKEEVKTLRIRRFNLPWGVRSGVNRNIKKGKLLVLWMYETKLSKFSWHETAFNSFLDENKVPHKFNEGDIKYLDGKTKIPFIIQPINDLKPLDLELKRQDSEDGEAAGILIKWLEKARLDTDKKKGGSWMWIIIIGIICLIGFMIYKYTQGG